jgi:hypothetical protein
MRTREPDVPVVRWVPFEIYGVGGGMVINLQCSVFKVRVLLTCAYRAHVKVS